MVAYYYQYYEEIKNINVVEMLMFPISPFGNYETVLLLPAFAVHLWLPLFALAAISAHAATWGLKAIGWMQWFLKQGQHHPFQAVGLVAAVIVFAVSATLQMLLR